MQDNNITNMFKFRRTAAPESATATHSEIYKLIMRQKPPSPRAYIASLNNASAKVGRSGTLAADRILSAGSVTGPLHFPFNSFLSQHNVPAARPAVGKQIVQKDTLITDYIAYTKKVEEAKPKPRPSEEEKKSGSDSSSLSVSSSSGDGSPSDVTKTDAAVKKENKKRRDKLFADMEALENSPEKLAQQRKEAEEERKRELALGREMRFRERRSIADFLRNVLSPDFYCDRSEERLKVPGSFYTSEQYVATWGPLFLHDVRTGILQAEKVDGKVISLTFTKQSVNPPFLQMNCATSSEERDRLRENDLILVSRTDQKSKLWELLAPGSDGVPHFARVGHGQTYAVGYVKRRAKDQAGFRYEVLFDQRGEEGMRLDDRVKNPQVDFFVRILGCISTQIREFQAMNNAEFVPLSEYILHPQKIKDLQALRRKDLPRDSESYFREMKESYNASQQEALGLVAHLGERDLILIQGPVRPFSLSECA